MIGIGGKLLIDIKISETLFADLLYTAFNSVSPIYEIYCFPEKQPYTKIHTLDSIIIKKSTLTQTTKSIYESHIMNQTRLDVMKSENPSCSQMVTKSTRHSNANQYVKKWYYPVSDRS